MKLLPKINRTYTVILIATFFAVTISGYFILKISFYNEAKENLYEKEFYIKEELKNSENLMNLYPLIEINKTDKKPISKPNYKKVEIKNELENEYETFLEYSNTIEINNKFYDIKLRQSLLENEDLIVTVSEPLILLLIIVFLASLIITKKINKTIWNDFEFNLKKIEEFSFNNFKNIQLKDSNIEEFDKLNSIIKNLTSKLSIDYKILKEFTENASHELQTPLSILTLNLEDILQEKLTGKALNKVYESYQAVKKLSKLNKNLLLLAKINNSQYNNNKLINFSKIINSKIEEFKPLTEEKKINIRAENIKDFIVNANPDLAEILINNLMSNAINHNIKEGFINIKITEKQIIFSNSGIKNELNNSNIFERFIKSNSESFGLGLAIVKNICNNFNFEINYIYKNDIHNFIISQQ
jgi:signal transduction histidine kinase